MAQALVTGATSGIGQAIALALHTAGHRVIAVGRDAAALDRLAGLGLTPLALDLGQTTGLSKRLAAALADSAPDVLVNNAGMVAPPGNFCDMAEADIHRSVATNLTQALLVTRAIAPGMRSRGKGHIFFTGSIAAHTPYPNMAIYAATKAALGGFAQSLRLDLSASDVRVTEIVAGRVESPLYKDVLSLEARAAMYAGNSAVQPEDVAAMVLAVLALPPHVDVARFDILPTRQPFTPQVPSEKEMKGPSIVIVRSCAGLDTLLARIAVADGSASLGIIDWITEAAEAALAPRGQPEFRSALPH